MTKKTLSQINKFLFPVLFGLFIATSFFADNYKTVDHIAPKALKDPLQTEPKNKNMIRFTKNDYKFEIKPLYDYEINGLVVSKFDYDSWLVSIRKTDKIFVTDLCIIWGSNLKKKIYKNPFGRFSQDMRFCNYQCHGGEFNACEFSNNHLIVKDKKMRNKIKKIRIGDQISLRGQLVSLSADLVKQGSVFDGQHITWQSSTTRQDGGHGACEVIYVEDVQILQRGNPVARTLKFLSLLSLFSLIIINLIQMGKPNKELENS
ncbi:MAG: hypothetical protein ABIC68_00235 [Candidatus Omnitrophota bacterium]